MPLRRAKKLCPAAVVLQGQYAIYRCFAEHIWQVCRRYTTGLETYLDEAYGDATGMEHIHGDPLRLGRRLRRQVREEVGLEVSVGLASNRMLAKIASSSAKPNGVAWIRPGREQSVLTRCPIEKLPGVGGRTAEMLRDMNIRTVGELRLLSRESLRCMLGRRGEVLHERCRGRDDQSVRPAAMPKSISRETTFHEPQCDPGRIRGMLFYLLERAARTARQIGLLARTVELSIRYNDWKESSASRTLPAATEADGELFPVVLELLEQLHHRRVALRHAGIVLSRFSPKSAQARLFEPAGHARHRRLYNAIDTIRDRWGHAAVVTGKSIELLGRLRQNDHGFVLRTPSLTK